MPIPALPWWPPSGYEDFPESQVRDPFAYLRTVTRPVMVDGERRIRETVGHDPPIRIHHWTVKSLTEKRLGSFDVLKVIHMEAGMPRERNVWCAIGLHRDGSLMVTPNPATHLVWVRWTGPDPSQRATSVPASPS